MPVYNIEGNWKAKEMTISGKAKVKGFPIPFNHTKDNECTKQSMLNLDQNNKGIILLKDDSIGNCMSFQEQSFNYVFDEANKKLNITFNNTTEFVEIENLTENNLTIQRSVENFSLHGINFTGTITIIFQKETT